MSKKVFIAGIHGVGKTTFCNSIKEASGISSYSCSNLIKENSQYIETSKAVSSAEKNQLALIKALKNLSDNNYLLDGHFCLLGPDESIIRLPLGVFEGINPSAVVLITYDSTLIHNRLVARDPKAIPAKVLEALQEAEIETAHDISQKLDVPIFHYISNTPIDECLGFIKHTLKN